MNANVCIDRSEGSRRHKLQWNGRAAVDDVHAAQARDGEHKVALARTHAGERWPVVVGCRLVSE